MIPSMTTPEMQSCLEEIGASWRGLGLAVEAGSWFGASACALARGLVRAGYDRPLHLYDKWTANESEVGKARAAGVEIEIGENLEPHCRANVEAVYPHVVTHRGWINCHRWTGGPIEIFVLDAGKRDPAFSTIMDRFGRAVVPGGWICLLDFHYWKRSSEENRAAYRCQPSWAQKHCSEVGEVEHVQNVGSAAIFHVVRQITKGDDAP